MKAAGSQEEVFAEDGILVAAEATGGVMRKLDVLGQTALELACENPKTKLVDAGVMQESVKVCAEAIV
jgi:hypothetical protein